MPTRVFSEDIITQKKRKSITRPDGEKPAKKSTKAIKQEIKKEPIDFSDDDINDDDVMDIEDADKTAKLLPNKQQRVVKTKKVKKVPKTEGGCGEPKEKVKQKRKKKVEAQPPAAAPNNENSVNGTTPKTPVAVNPSADSNGTTPKPVKKTPKVKEKKIKEKKTPQPPKANPVKKQTKPEETTAGKKPASDSESNVEETDTYETCGVAKCQRPSGEI